MRDSIGVQRIASAQQHANDIFHHGLAALRSQGEDLQVFFCTPLRSVFFPQRIVGKTKPACWKQILAVAIVLKRTRLANQPINDVPVIDPMFTPAA